MRKVVFILVLLSLFVLSFSYKFTTTPYKFPELKFFPKMPVAEKNPVTVEGVNLGRHLFYDPILSSDSTMSCASCHHQEFAFSDSPNWGCTMWTAARAVGFLVSSAGTAS